MEWYVMRNLKRSNAKTPAYKLFLDENIEIFSPMKWCLKVKNGKQTREKVPFIQNLLFVHYTRDRIDTIVNRNPTIQYRYLKGRGAYCKPMVVREIDMNRFIRAIDLSDNPKYYLPAEITLEMCKRKIRIIGGEFDGYEGSLLTVSGSKIKRLLVELTGPFSAGIEVNPD